MYLKQLRVKRMKRVRDLELSFPEVEGRPRPWTVLIGENGTAKTTLLQAIALAAAGRSEVNAVIDRGVELLRDRRTADEPLEIEAAFVFPADAPGRPGEYPFAPAGAHPAGLRSSVSLDPRSTSLRARSAYLGPEREALPGDDPLEQARAVHAPGWFVAGYGVARVLPDSAYTPDLAKRSIERLKPLFDHRAPLASVGFANHFSRRDAEQGKKAGTRARRFGKLLNDLLRAGGDALMPGIGGLELRGAGGTKAAADLIDSDRFRVRMGRGEEKIAGVALSHGFQSTFAWIADLVGHMLLEADDELGTEEMRGLVLIDEIDLYLHPRWQATFASALRRVFPGLQFIATSHSPVALAGLQPSEIVRLQADPETGDVRQVGRHPGSGELVPVAQLGGPPAEADPRAMTGTEIYEDYFGIEGLTLNPHGDDLRAWLAIAGDPLRSEAQERQLDVLEGGLRQALGALPPRVAREEDPA
jgi:hypothetical protein